MKYKQLFFYTAVLLIGLLSISILKATTVNSISTYTPVFKIIGDVANPLSINSYPEAISTKLQHKGMALSAIPLILLLEDSQPASDFYDIYIKGSDGLMAMVHSSTIEESYIAFSEENGWEAIQLKHPISSNIKHIQEIIIKVEGESWDTGFNIISSEENLASYSIGELLTNGHTLQYYSEGTSRVADENKGYETTVYTTRRILELSRLYQHSASDGILVIGSKGEETFFSDEGYLQLMDNSITYSTISRAKRIDNVKGLVINPTIGRTTDAYYDSLHYLEQGNKVMLLFLDGFGYHQYQLAKTEGYAPFISSLPEASKVMTVYQPVTNAGFAAMITGKTPEENGVYSRQQKDMLMESIFGKATALGKKSALVEGNIKILNTETEPILNLDSDNSGTTDEEVFSAAMALIQVDYDFMLVHFHGIDDRGHSYGDTDTRTLNQIQQVDEYVRQLSRLWDGKIIIISDHGMHETDEGGSHGTLRYQDMFVPYIVYDGGEGQ